MTARRLVVAAGLVGLYSIAVGSLATRAQLWNDELYTWYVARLPTLGDVWEVLSTGVEQLPPAYYVIVRASLWTLGENDVALRLPSALGLLLACVCLFAVVSRRAGVAYGLVAALLPLASGAFTYAWEARPYALVVGLSALAVLCHQLRADGVRPRLAVLGLALGLAGATAVHYYGALSVLPLALAELVRATERRTLDRPVVLALVAPAIPLAASAPLLLEARRYAGAFWTEFDLSSAPEFFVFLLRADVFSSSRIPTWLGIVFAAVVLGGAVAILLRPPRFARLEVATGIGFVLLPLAGVLVGATVTGAYVERYVLAAVLGPALLLPLALARLGGAGRTVPVVAAGVLALWFLVLFQYWHREIGVDNDRRARLIAFLERAPGDTDIAVAHPHDFLELAHDSPTRVAARLVRLSDPERALEITGSRSTEDGLVVLADLVPLRVAAYRERTDPFLLLRTVRGSEPDWIVEALADDGAATRAVAEDRDDGFLLELVVPRPTTGHASTSP